MSVFIYNIFLALFNPVLRIASIWNKKAQQWVDGRKNIFSKLKNAIGVNVSKTIWVHCSSLGEFEQGRPIIEMLKNCFPEHKIMLTFFSPSGYEVRKNYGGADWVFYLPMDSKKNAIQFLDIVKPGLFILVKYDYWYYYLRECNKRNIPIVLISGIFREQQPFSKWYGKFHRTMLACITQLFVQDQHSKELLQKIKIKNVSVAGDTRFDRVIDIAENFQPIEFIENFCNNSPTLVAGSTWPEDERIINESIAGISNLKLIIAPHEIHKEHIEQIQKVFPDAILFSEIQQIENIKKRNCLVIDNIGMLSRLYHYGTITYVGGGFNAGIHNTLEAAVHGKPVIFGPEYQKFKEAIDLIKTGGGFTIKDHDQLKSLMQLLLTDNKKFLESSNSAKEYVLNNKGATEKIVNYILENRLLTN